MQDPETKLQLKRHIQAVPATVFNAWVDAGLIAQWFAPEGMTIPLAESDPRVGGEYKISMLNRDGETFTTYGEYLEIVDSKKLVFSWGWERPDRHVSEVTVKFVAVEGGTEVQVTHVRHRDREARDSHIDGWQSCLNRLETLLAN